MKEYFEKIVEKEKLNINFFKKEIPALRRVYNQDLKEPIVNFPILSSNFQKLDEFN